MSFESPDNEKDFPGLYSTQVKGQEPEHYSDEENDQNKTKKRLADFGKKKKKDKNDKDKGYKMFEQEDSDEEPMVEDSKSPSKGKKHSRPSFKFVKKEKSKSKEEKKEKDGKKEGRNKIKIDLRRKPKIIEEEQKPIFGVPLATAVERSKCHDGIELPMIFRECIDYIEEHGLSCEGIYRISGVKSKIQALKDCYNKGTPVYLNEHEPNMVASLLKQYLRELPEPVLTTALMPKFEEASTIKEHKVRIEKLRKLRNDLPLCNRTLLSWMMVHMCHIIQREKVNKMSLQNVSIVLSPTMKISHRVLNMFFLHAKELFKDTVIKKYVPPIKPATSRWSLEIPDDPSYIREELAKQESLLSQLHEELKGVTDPEKEEQLWEVQRVVTQLKRKVSKLPPEDPAKIEADLKAQEALLSKLHEELNSGNRDEGKEDELWEVQRQVTQLKRKLKHARKASEAVEASNKTPSTKKSAAPKTPATAAATTTATATTKTTSTTATTKTASTSATTKTTTTTATTKTASTEAASKLTATNTVGKGASAEVSPRHAKKKIKAPQPPKPAVSEEELNLELAKPETVKAVEEKPVQEDRKEIIDAKEVKNENQNAPKEGSETATQEKVKSKEYDHIPEQAELAVKPDNITENVKNVSEPEKDIDTQNTGDSAKTPENNETDVIDSPEPSTPDTLVATPDEESTENTGQDKASPDEKTEDEVFESNDKHSKEEEKQAVEKTAENEQAIENTADNTTLKPAITEVKTGDSASDSDEDSDDVKPTKKKVRVKREPRIIDESAEPGQIPKLQPPESKSKPKPKTPGVVSMGILKPVVLHDQKDPTPPVREKPRYSQTEDLKIQDTQEVIAEFLNRSHDGDSESDITPTNTGDAELEYLLEDETRLLLEEEELLAIGDELRKKIETEQIEVERLKQEIEELQELRQDSIDLDEDSSDMDSSSSESEDEEELQEILNKLIQENQELEVKNAELCQSVDKERQICLEVKVQIRLLQQQAKARSGVQDIVPDMITF